MEKTFDIIDFTKEQKPEDVAKVFADLVDGKIEDLLTTRKAELAASMFTDQVDNGDSDALESEEEADGPEDNEDVEDVDIDDLSDAELEELISNLDPETLAELEKELADEEPSED